MSVSASFLCFHFFCDLPHNDLIIIFSVSVGILPEFSPVVFIIPKHLLELDSGDIHDHDHSHNGTYIVLRCPCQPAPTMSHWFVSTPSVSIYLTSGSISGMNLVRTCGHYLLFKVVFSLLGLEESLFWFDNNHIQLYLSLEVPCWGPMGLHPVL